MRRIATMMVLLVMVVATGFGQSDMAAGYTGKIDFQVIPDQPDTGDLYRFFAASENTSLMMVVRVPAWDLEPDVLLSALQDDEMLRTLRAEIPMDIPTSERWDWFKERLRGRGGKAELVLDVLIFLEEVICGDLSGPECLAQRTAYYHSHEDHEDDDHMDEGRHLHEHEHPKPHSHRHDH